MEGQDPTRPGAAFEALLDASHDDAPARRGEALAALAACDDLRALPRLLAALDDDDEAERVVSGLPWRLRAWGGLRGVDPGATWLPVDLPRLRGRLLALAEAASPERLAPLWYALAEVATPDDVTRALRGAHRPPWLPGEALLALAAVALRSLDAALFALHEDLHGPAPERLRALEVIAHLAGPEVDAWALAARDEEAGRVAATVVSLLGDDALWAKWSPTTYDEVWREAMEAMALASPKAFARRLSGLLGAFTSHSIPWLLAIGAPSTRRLILGAIWSRAPTPWLVVLGGGALEYARRGDGNHIAARYIPPDTTRRLVATQLAVASGDGLAANYERDLARDLRVGMTHPEALALAPWRPDLAPRGYLASVAMRAENAPVHGDFACAAPAPDDAPRLLARELLGGMAPTDALLRGLGATGDPIVDPVLRHVARVSPQATVRADALRAAAWIAAPLDEPPAVDGDALVDVALAELLGARGAHDAVARLHHLACPPSPEAVRCAALTALAALPGDAAERLWAQLDRPFGADVVAAVDALARHGADARARLAARAPSAPPALAYAIAASLRPFGVAVGRPSAPPERYPALGVDALVRLWATETSPHHRRADAIVAWSRGASVVDALLPRLEELPWRLRAALADALRVEAPSGAVEVARTLVGDSARVVLVSALACLAALGGDDDAAELARRTRDPRPEVRLAAAEALVFMAGRPVAGAAAAARALLAEGPFVARTAVLRALAAQQGWQPLDAVAQAQDGGEVGAAGWAALARSRWSEAPPPRVGAWSWDGDEPPHAPVAALRLGAGQIQRLQAAPGARAVFVWRDEVVLWRPCERAVVRRWSASAGSVTDVHVLAHDTLAIEWKNGADAERWTSGWRPLRSPTALRFLPIDGQHVAVRTRYGVTIVARRLGPPLRRHQPRARGSWCAAPARDGAAREFEGTTIVRLPLRGEVASLRNDAQAHRVVVLDDGDTVAVDAQQRLAWWDATGARRPVERPDELQHGGGWCAFGDRLYTARPERVAVWAQGAVLGDVPLSQAAGGWLLGAAVCGGALVLSFDREVVVRPLALPWRTATAVAAGGDALTTSPCDLGDGAFACGDASGTIRVFEASSGALRATLRGAEGRVEVLAALDDGSLVAATSKGLWAWRADDVRTARGDPRGRFADDQALVALDARHVVAAVRGGAVEVRDARARGVTRTLAKVSWPVDELLCPDAATVFGRSPQGDLARWDARTGALVATAKAPRAIVDWIPWGGGLACLDHAGLYAMDGALVRLSSVTCRDAARVMAMGPRHLIAWGSHGAHLYDASLVSVKWVAGTFVAVAGAPNRMAVATADGAIVLHDLAGERRHLTWAAPETTALTARGDALVARDPRGALRVFAPASDPEAPWGMRALAETAAGLTGDRAWWRGENGTAAWSVRPVGEGLALVPVDPREPVQAIEGSDGEEVLGCFEDGTLVTRCARAGWRVREVRRAT